MLHIGRGNCLLIFSPTGYTDTSPNGDIELSDSSDSEFDEPKQKNHLRKRSYLIVTLISNEGYFKIAILLSGMFHIVSN
jgi:hypothetical protein